MRRLLLAAAVLALGACVEEAGPGTGGPGAPEGKPLSAAERTECLAKGGTVGRGGLLPDELCFLPLADGGKACTKKADCEGMCLVDPVSRAASCAKVSPQFGCFDFLDEDGREMGICVD